MVSVDELRSIQTRRTPLGFEYVVMADVPLPWREQCWAWLPSRNARLEVEGVGLAALVQDWHQWLDSLSNRSAQRRAVG